MRFGYYNCKGIAFVRTGQYLLYERIVCLDRHINYSTDPEDMAKGTYRSIKLRKG